MLLDILGRELPVLNEEGGGFAVEEEYVYGGESGSLLPSGVF